ncbi:MAG TPA: M48 family metallopeptidase [Thermoanaerobaculia bacterium]|nr:M48 family metallopeptidase [Thermoanaerobaculia bacterium]
MRSLFRMLFCALVLLLVPGIATAAETGAETGGPAPASAAAGPAFDPVAATEAYLARMSPQQRARSDAYFEGGYWLQLWGLLYGLGVFALLLGTRLSARLRDAVQRRIRSWPLQILLYAVGFILLVTLLSFPLSIYTDYVREHQYGMSNQTFGAWFGEELTGLAVGMVLGGLSLLGLYTVLRKAPRTWWIWGTVVSVAFLIIGALIAPVFIAPLFNTYTELREEPLRTSILSLARANGIPAEHVYVVDASRQTKRISANVSGLGGTLRISLNDNLLRRTSPAAVEAVMGHEMGHYVLNHIYELILEMGVVLFLGFAFLRWSFGKALARWGERWGVRGVDDPAGLPLFAALFSLYFFIMTPVTNTIIRSNEAEADIYGINSSRQPDGFAEAALLLGEYRKMAPGPLEEWIFFDHPSGRNRILMAMRWKAENAGKDGEPR